MHRARDIFLRLLLPVIMSVCVSTFAADDDIVIESKSANVEDDRNAILVNMARFEVPNNDQIFERQIYRAADALGGRWQDNSELVAAVNCLDRFCKLSEFQKEKLALAGRADLKNFSVRVEAARLVNRTEMRLSDEFLAEVQSLAMKSDTGLLCSGSFFAKSVQSILTTDQLDKCRRSRLLALVDNTVRIVESKTSLQPSQRAAIIAIMSEESPTPAVFWIGANAFRKIEVLEMTHRFSSLADTRVKPLLNAVQWERLKVWLEEFRRSHDTLLFEEGRVVPGQNQLVPAQTQTVTYEYSSQRIFVEPLQ